MSDHEIARPVASSESAGFEPVIGPSTEGLGEYLLKDGKLKTPDAFARLRTESLTILRRCKPFDKKPGQRTGLVVGYVQSGKTMSMMCVTSLARDNGCRIVVLLAGVTKNLLRQNAGRFRETLRSAAGGEEHWIILNSEDGKSRQTDGQTLRNAVDEWRDKSFDPQKQRTLFFAVLKNYSHLDWLKDLLVKENLGDTPTLIFDDEADQAGLNVGGEDDPSTTYRMIQAVRNALPNHTYLQYTATPQAPLLISIDDMLSPQFVELVEPGEGYTGGMIFFPEKKVHPYVRRVPIEDQFKPGNPPQAPPHSLVESMAVFFVGCGVVRLRGGPSTRSMLIHPSVRNTDHSQFLTWANAVQKRWNSALSKGDAEDRADALADLEEGYKDLATTDANLPPFADLVPEVRLSLSRAQCKIVNSEDGSDIDWANAAEHILVGGEKLNRGYTVEGLMVTYMPRDSGGWNADTIQQRARFFGYKGSYLSLCRIYLHPDVHDAYKNYVVHERDVRRQLKEHQGRPLREWRRAFFLDAKMRPTRSNVLSDPLFRVKRDKHWFVQRYPHADPGSIEANAALVEGFTAALQFMPGTGDLNGHLVAETTLSLLLETLLLEFKVPRETANWYAHLVTLSNDRAEDPHQRVLVVKMNEGENRARTPGKGDEAGAITLHQGRSSSGSGKGDKAVFEKDTVTLQIHALKVDGVQRVPIYALALYVPKIADAIASGVGT